MGIENTQEILISGGMCRFAPFRKWLEETFPGQVRVGELVD
jgi:hypothetical protein